MALAKIAAGQHLQHGVCNHTSQILPGFPGRGGPPDSPCGLPIAAASLPSLAKLHGIDTSVHTKFVKTEVAR